MRVGGGGPGGWGLVESGQVQMAFLAGIVELEGRLRRKLVGRAKESRGARGRPASLRDLLIFAMNTAIVTITRSEVDDLVNARNRIVHGGDVSPDTLDEITK